MAASRRNRYAKSLTGLNAIGFFSPVAAYTAAATYTAFVQTAPGATNGQLGIFAYPAMTTVTTNALTAGSQFFIAQVIDGDIKKSPILTHNGTAASFTNYTGPSYFLKKTVYSAPVLQQQVIGYNPGTSTGDLGLVAGTLSSPITYSFSARDVSPANQPFPVQSASVVSSLSTAGNVKLELTAALCADFINSLDYQNNSDVEFCYADVTGNGTLTNIATVTATFIGGSTTVTYSDSHTLTSANVGNWLFLVGPKVYYKIVAVPSTTVLIIDRPYQLSNVAVGVNFFTTAAGGTSYVSTANLSTVTQTGIQVTAVTEDVTFLLSYASIPANLFTTVTAWQQGSGAAWQVALMEQDTAVMSGFTNANYPWIIDVGQPTFFVTNAELSAVQYTLYFIKYSTTVESMAFANSQHQSFGYIIVACPNSGGPDTTVSTVLIGS